MARGSLITFTGSAGGAIASLLLLVVLARGSGVAEAGLFFQAVAVVSTGAIVCNLGAQIALMQRVARHLAHGQRDLTTLVWTATFPVAAAATATGLLLAVFHAPLAHLLTEPAHEQALGGLLVAIAPALPLIALTRLTVTLSRGTGEMGPAAIYDSGGQPVLRLMLCGLVSVTGGPVWLLGAAFSAASALCLAASVPHALGSLRRAQASLSPRARWDVDTFRSFWRFSAPRGLEEIFAATNVWLLVILVGALFSAPEAATYAAISRFTLGATMFMQAITTGMAPRFTAAFARNEKERVLALFQITTQWMVGVSVPVCAALLVFPEAFLSLVSPDLPGGAIGLQITAVAALFTVVTGPAGAAILFAGRSSWNLWIAISAFAVMLGVAFPTIPAQGANGASLAWAAAMLVQSGLAYVVAKRAFGLDPFSRSALRLGAWSAILSAVALLIPRVLLGDGILAMIVGVTATGVGLVLMHLATSWSWWSGAASDRTTVEAG